MRAEKGWYGDGVMAEQILAGKVGLVFGVANKRSIAWAIAKAWAAADKLATGDAFYVPWLWDNQINFTSKNVNGVKNEFNSSWDLTASSLK